MASRRTRFLVGLFVACGLVLAVGAFVWLGMSRILEKGDHYVTYFDESVQGLSVDSPVKYRGVPVGRVERILVAPDGRLIEVLLNIESGEKLAADVAARLQLVGITGSLYIELERRKEGEADRSPELNFPTKYPVVPSKPSELSELLSGIAGALNQIQALDIEGISTRIKATLESTSRVVADANVKEISKNIESFVNKLDRMLDERKWNRILESVEEAGSSLNRVLTRADRVIDHLEIAAREAEEIVLENRGDIGEAVEHLRDAAFKADRALEQSGALVQGTGMSIARVEQSLMVVMRNLEEASENLKRLVDALSERPSKLIFDYPPEPREVETRSMER